MFAWAVSGDRLSSAVYSRNGDGTYEDESAWRSARPQAKGRSDDG